jgi:hypothetical protein
MRCPTATSLLLAAPLLAALGGCSDDRAPPPATTSTSTAATAQAEPPRAAPVTAFDGRYTGTMTLNPDRTRRCPEASSATREATVAQGRARFTVNPAIREVLTGTLDADGSARMASNIDRSIATTGVFTSEAFLGEHRNGLCSYSVNLKKVS